VIGFISAGFNPPMSFTKEELDFLDNSQLILVDTYTSPDYLKKLGERELTFVGRDKLENYEWILSEERKVAIVIPGDSFSATTHFNIYKEALLRGLEVKIFHNASIFPTAALSLGLHLYKIGPAVSLPRFKDKFKPVSPYEKMLENFRKGLHTILLLDTEPPLELSDALDELLWMESELKGGLFGYNREIGVVSSLGTPSEKVVYAKISDLKEWKEGKPPLTIIITAELHFQEKEALDLFKI
jgi:diphthine synthase